MLNLFPAREMSPAGRKISPARHVRESDDAAVVETDALLARSLEWRACHARVCGGRRARDKQRRARLNRRLLGADWMLTVDCTLPLRRSRSRWYGGETGRTRGVGEKFGASSRPFTRARDCSAGYLGKIPAPWAGWPKLGVGMPCAHAPFLLLKTPYGRSVREPWPTCSRSCRFQCRGSNLNPESTV
jgi:hypothetical protein